ncbi:class I SAM-dependent methyltransferase [Spirosoma rhododendri]|uniref:Class I SAM-dependent methyltransferase n=1 Tax=Spirosoma rhododendri TaxID=2728024 RepID=A0A7L5DKR8_9BACT|nr:class I SAM-dependent methyltransferase [Spirosoma rhododendri]QJD78685.1 class I SAM-dependent methyltransferase [Spirosoma rhododendri]
MICRICASEAKPLFRATILSKYEVGYYECPTCRFVQTETPYWLDEAYQSAFTTTDTGTLRRGQVLGDSAIALLFFLFNRHGRFVDYAGGYGVLTRYMRDAGFDFFTTDPYAPNLLAKGFEADTPTDAAGRYELATAFECFEHFVNPADELRKILAYSDNVFFTTQPCPDPAPALDKWWYYAPHHGQHVALYRPETLAYLGKQEGLHYYNLLNYHLYTRKPLPPLVFPLLVAAGRFGLASVLRLFLKSKTVSDATLLEQRTQAGRLTV